MSRARTAIANLLRRYAPKGPSELVLTLILEGHPGCPDRKLTLGSRRTLSGWEPLPQRLEELPPREPAEPQNPLF